MEKAKQGIRFITPGYKELFRISDGDHIRIFTGGGGTRDRTCRFIDETHFETSGGYSSALYHICEFAERLEQSHGSVIPLRLLFAGTLLYLSSHNEGNRHCKKVKVGITAATLPLSMGRMANSLWKN